MKGRGVKGSGGAGGKGGFVEEEVANIGKTVQFAHCQHNIFEKSAKVKLPADWAATARHLPARVRVCLIRGSNIHVYMYCFV